MGTDVSITMHQSYTNNAPNANINGTQYRGHYDECLNREWFHNVREARMLAESYRRYDNQQRPHPPKDSMVKVK
jgi:hypothetical protein